MIEQYKEPDTRVYFSATHKGHVVELEADITLIQGAHIPCVVLDGPHMGCEVYRRAMPIVALYEQQQEESY